MTITPTAWNDTTVGTEFEVQLGKMLDAAKNVGSLKPYLGNRAVQWGRIDLTAAGVVPLTRRDMERFRLHKGDLLVCEGGEVGRAAIWEYDTECYYQKALHRLRTRRGYNSHILLALLELRAWSDGFSDYVTQTSIAHLPRDKFIELPIPAIPSTEQIRIAGALLDVDRLIVAIERAIVKKRDIKQGIMQGLLAGKTRLPGFSGRWSRTTVGEIAKVKTGPFGSALHEADYVTDGVPIITVEHLGEYRVQAEKVPMVSEADYRRLSAYTLVSGDIVFSRVGSIDRNSLISTHEESWLFSGRLLRVRLNTSKADPAFISAQFHARPFREAVNSVAVGQTMLSLNTEILKGVAVDLPSLPEQKAVGKVAVDLNLELESLYERLAKAKAVKRGMMQELLTGRTRLPVEAAAYE